MAPCFVLFCFVLEYHYIHFNRLVVFSAYRIGVQALFCFFLVSLEDARASLARAQRRGRSFSVLHNTSGILHFTLAAEPYH